MPRCLHLYEGGPQCQLEAVSGGDFCEDHERADAEVERLDDHPFRKLIVRLVALVLLIIFLIPFYYSFKALYLAPSFEVGEGN